MSSESAIRLAWPEEPTEAPEAPPVRIVATPKGWIRAADLVSRWPHGGSPGARIRDIQRYCQSLADNPKTANIVEKQGREWYLSPVGPNPLTPDDRNTNLRDFLFVHFGQVVHDLVGVYISPALAAQLEQRSERERAAFFKDAMYARRYREHEVKNQQVKRRQRDRLFELDEELAAWCEANNITRRRARAVRAWLHKVEVLGIWPDQRGRPLKGADDWDRDCSPEAWEAFRLLYLTEQRRSVNFCWRQVAVQAQERGWRWPTNIGMVRRRVKAELPPPIADFHRLGFQRWEQQYGTFIERDRAAQFRPNECWCCDHTQVDNFPLFRGRHLRPRITAWVDMATGKVLSWAITLRPNSDVILATFRAAVFRYGAPKRVVFDNGKDFRAKAVAGGRRGRFDKAHVEGVMGRLGIAVTWTRIYHGQSKAAVERFFGTCGSQFYIRFESYPGSSPVNRPEKFHQKLKAGKIAAPSLDEYRTAFGEFVALYNTAQFREGKSRDELFEIDPIARRTAPEEVLRVLCLPTRRCKVGRLGVHIDVWYGQDEIALLRYKGQDVLVRYDPADAASVDVLTLDGRLIARCENARLRGLIRDDLRQAGARRKAEARLCKAARPAQIGRLKTKVSVAHEIAAERKFLERQRLAAGAETQTVAVRNVELLPGAGEAAAQLAQRQQRERRDAEAAETHKRMWELMATPDPTPQPVEMNPADMLGLFADPEGEVPERDAGDLLQDFCNVDAPERRAQRRSLALLVEKADLEDQEEAARADEAAERGEVEPAAARLAEIGLAEMTASADGAKTSAQPADYSVFTEITEREQAEQARRDTEAEERHQELVDWQAGVGPRPAWLDESTESDEETT